MYYMLCCSSRRRHTRCALVTGVQTCALPICGDATQAQGVLGLRWRLFDFGRVDAEIAAARGRDAEALAAYRLAVLRASEDVENAFSALVEREAQEQALSPGAVSRARARAASCAASPGCVVKSRSASWRSRVGAYV